MIRSVVRGTGFKGPAEAQRDGELYHAGAEFFQRRSGLERGRIRAIVLIRVETSRPGALAVILAPGHGLSNSDRSMRSAFMIGVPSGVNQCSRGRS